MSKELEKPRTKKELAYLDDVNALADYLMHDPELDGARRDIPDMTSHFFAPGVYCRMYWLPEGDLALGKAHKTTHLNILCRGVVVVATPDGPIQFDAKERPIVFVSEAGDQKTIYCIEECFWITIHPTEETDLDKLEAMLVDSLPAERDE